MVQVEPLSVEICCQANISLICGPISTFRGALESPNCVHSDSIRAEIYNAYIFIILRHLLCAPPHQALLPTCMSATHVVFAKYTLKH